MNFKLSFPLPFLSILFIWSCANKIDGTNMSSFINSVEEIRDDLSIEEVDSLERCMQVILKKSGYKISQVNKIIPQLDGLTADDLFEEGALIIKEEKRINDSIKNVFVKDSIKKYNEQGRWELKYFVDENDQKRGSRYLENKGKGIFSNSVANDDELNAKIRYTVEGELQIILFEYGSQVVKTFDTDGQMYFVKSSLNNHEVVTKAWMYNDRIYIEDENIINQIKEGGELKMYLRKQSRFGMPSTYMFDFDVTNFEKALAKLESK